MQQMIAVGGDDTYECRNVLAKLFVKKPWSRYYAERNEASALLAASFVREKKIVVFSNVSQEDSTALLDFMENPTQDIFVVLSLFDKSEKKSRKKKSADTANYITDVVEKLPKKQVFIFNLPPFYKQKDAAITFFVNSLKQLGKEISTDLATVIVDRVGKEKGVLAYEAQKIALYAGDITQVTPQQVTPIIAPLAETPMDLLSNAILSRNERATLHCLQRIKATYAEPLMLVTSYLLSKCESWLVAVDFQHKKVNAKQAAELLGRNAWEYETNVYVPARSMTRETLERLIEVIAEAQQSLFAGASDAFLVFEANLLSVLW